MATPLLLPRDGVPPLITNEDQLRRLLDQLEKGTGPIAIDAERASGFRYGQRAYLIQLNRKGGGLHLIDPIPLTGSKLINEFNTRFAGCEWIIHASTQDLPCLNEFGIFPEKLFDTELGARIAGCERVGLGPLAESLLDLLLAKEHSAVDWSTRPLPIPWLTYAALDVEILLDLRDAVKKLLESSNKIKWAEEEFAAILNAPPAKPRKDPWRRTSGMHKIRKSFEMAIIRELWLERDRVAREIDLAPGRLFSDTIIVETATVKPETFAAFKLLPTMKFRIKTSQQREFLPSAFAALTRAQEMLESDHPEVRTPIDASSMPQLKIWRERFPLAFARLSHARFRVGEAAQVLAMPTENLISPELIRKICWLSQSDASLIDNPIRVDEQLTELGARQWQRSQVAAIIASALTETEPLPPPVVEVDVEVAVEPETAGQAEGEERP